MSTLKRTTSPVRARPKSITCFRKAATCEHIRLCRHPKASVRLTPWADVWLARTPFWLLVQTTMECQYTISVRLAWSVVHSTPHSLVLHHYRANCRTFINLVELMKLRSWICTMLLCTCDKLNPSDDPNMERKLFFWGCLGFWDLVGTTLFGCWWRVIY